MQNKYILVKCSREKISVTDRASDETIFIPWKSIYLQIANKSENMKVVTVSEEDGIINFEGSAGDINISATIRLEPNLHWCTLQTTFCDMPGNLPTPDLISLGESDSLAFEAVGYKHENAYQSSDKAFDAQAGEEASGGRIPGCGYPIFSKNFFVGIEHVAAYTLVKNTGFSCKHYASWNSDHTISAPAVVIGTKARFKTVKESFLNYIDCISIPKEQIPFLCACTFWSDPFIGNSEYRVNVAHYLRYVEQFIEAGIKPEMLMLDAGWNDRNSIFQAKKDIGGDDGLMKVSSYLAEHGIKFGLWSSINGNMGVSHEWASEQGYPVGSGLGAAYSFPHQFVVLMDNEFAEKVAERHVELLEKTNCKFFKVDWDCECATNDDFNDKYPTPNHVRVASIDVINQIHAEIIKNDTGCHIRNGWWPSPWWLKHVTLTWLANSGDCEYSALPSLTQRDRATTHRDAMYYYIFKESKTPLPLDSIDNHEIAKALRNPFSETFESWCNTVVMLYMRGTVYLSVMVNAATLSEKEAVFFAEVKHFAENYKHILFNKSACFIGGNPAAGKTYGFLHQTEDEAIAVIRNPSIIPSEFSISEFTDSIDFIPEQTVAIYPYCASVTGDTIDLLSHQVVVLYFRKVAEPLPTEISTIPFTISADNKTYLAAGLEPDDSFGTIQEEFAMIRDIAAEIIGSEKVGSKTTTYLEVAVPDRMQNPTAIFEFRGATEEELDRVAMRIYHDRYPKTGKGHAVPVTTLYPKRKEGCGTIGNIHPQDIDKDVQYRLCPVPTGGQCFLDIDIDNISQVENLKITLHLSGKRGQSRKGKELEQPEIFAHTPRTHPAGIGQFCTVKLL